MRYVDSKRIEKESKDIPDGEIFTIYFDDGNTRGATEKGWSFAMRVNEEMTVTKPLPTDATPEQVKKAMGQIKYAKENGWSGTSEMGMDDIGARGRIYRCLYCKAESVGVDGPCPCRGKPKPKGLEDFIFPSDW